MRKFFTMALGLLGFVAFAQTGRVGVNTESPTASLQVKSKTGKDASTKNLELTNASNTNLVTVLDNGNVGIGVSTPAEKLEVVGKVKIVDGTQGEGKVLTSDDRGVARWDNITQHINNNFSVTSIVDPNILGYIPSNTATADNSPKNPSINSKTFHKMGTTSYNGHSYAMYCLNTLRNITWYDAYDLSKELGGYLATFTTDEEWQHVEENFLNTTVYDRFGAWIGMARFEWYAGPAFQPNPEMKWITGEQPRHDYSLRGNHSVRKSNWFYQNGINGNQPDNYSNREGFVHTTPKNLGRTKTIKGYTSTHPWNDFPSDPETATTPIDVQCLLVEFQQ